MATTDVGRRQLTGPLSNFGAGSGLSADRMLLLGGFTKHLTPNWPRQFATGLLLPGRRAPGFPSLGLPEDNNFAMLNPMVQPAETYARFGMAYAANGSSSRRPDSGQVQPGYYRGPTANWRSGRQQGSGQSSNLQRTTSGGNRRRVGSRGGGGYIDLDAV
ncbi:unnamed protein product [Protopolystoma xenopodis]|uniref:Uncharacterized protein n=1 Tax=Protopolystoma xenopodis TaxID=117903 RepID=A0A3S5AGY8_9PLAT|nr:unnamed protein product [Protopolystoma xenopodis]